jgi:hypothetical protein
MFFSGSDDEICQFLARLQQFSGGSVESADSVHDRHRFAVRQNRQIAPPQCAFVYKFAWSPDGRTLTLTQPDDANFKAVFDRQ